MNGNSVMAKIAGIKNESVELATQKVDLALSDDAKSVLKEAASQAIKHKKLLATIRKSGDSINAALKASGVLNNKQLGKLIVQRGQKLQQQFLKMEKELGVSLKGSELDKQISEIVMNGEDIQGSIDDTFSALTQIGK